jgi:uncharacterized protein (TIGR00251 family)
VPLRPAGDGVRIAVRLTPRGRADRLDGVGRLADGAPVLKVSVTAPPVEGQANDALLRLLAREWDLPRRDLAIVGGKKSRIKIVRIAGEPASLAARLGAELAALPHPPLARSRRREGWGS